MDWVPCSGYGLNHTILATNLHQFSMLDLDNLYDDEQVVGVVEEARPFKVHRIVGQYVVTHADADEGQPSAICSVRIWPGMTSSPGVVTTPAGVGASISGAGNVLHFSPSDSDIVSNGRFWYDRVFGVQNRDISQDDEMAVGAMLDPVVHPWWNFVDIKPRQWCGQQEVPVLSVGSVSTAFLLRYWFRMLVTRKRA